MSKTASPRSVVLCLSTALALALGLAACARSREMASAPRAQPSSAPTSAAGTTGPHAIGPRYRVVRVQTALRVRAARPAAILHAGDIGDAGVLRALEAIAPTLPVRGNIDGRANDLPDELVIAVRDAARERVVLAVFLTHIALRGPQLVASVAKRAHEAGASLVVCGHSHVPFAGRDRELTVFNPGSAGPRRFTLPIVFGLIELQPAPRVSRPDLPRPARRDRPRRARPPGGRRPAAHRVHRGGARRLAHGPRAPRRTPAHTSTSESAPAPCPRRGWRGWLRRRAG